MDDGRMNAPEKRFSDRVVDYVKHRPSYPEEVIATLRRECRLGPQSVVADVGSGTGIFSALLLEIGCRVIGVEPNDQMRAAAEERFRGEPRFESRGGSAEATGLESASVDLVTAAQAFHWFRRDEARREFARILCPSGAVALVWNHRKVNTPFLRAYEELLTRYSAEYAQSKHRDLDDAEIEEFFGRERGGMRRWTFPSEQRLDLDGVKGRLMSSSYAPKPDRAEHAPLIRGVEEAFAAHARDGRVGFSYETRVYLGRVS